MLQNHLLSTLAGLCLSIGIIAFGCSSGSHSDDGSGDMADSADTTAGGTSTDSNGFGGDTDDASPIDTAQLAAEGIGLALEEVAIASTGAASVAENLNVLPETVIQHSFTTPDSISFPLDDAGDYANLSPGDVMLSPEFMLLRKVVSSEIVGDDIVFQTEDATLDDVFDTADVTLTVGGEFMDAKADDASDGTSKSWLTATLSDVTLYESESESFKLSIASGSMSVAPKIQFDLVYDLFGIELAQIVTSGNVTIDAQFKAEGEMTGPFSGSKSIPLFEKSTVVMLGGVPVHVTPFVKVNFTVEGAVDGKAEATGGVSLMVPLNNTVTYLDGNFSHMSGGKTTIAAKPEMSNSAEATFNSKVSFDVEVGLKIYSKLSTSIKVGPYAKLDVSLFPQCNYTLVGGVDGTIGVKLDRIFGFIDAQASEPFELFNVSKYLTTGNCDGSDNYGGILCNDPTDGQGDLVFSHDISSNWPDNIAECTVLTRDIIYAENTTPQDLEKLSNIQQILGTVEIRENSGVSSLAGLENLRSVSSISVFGDVDMSALAHLEKAGSISIFDNSALTSLNFLSNLHTSGEDNGDGMLVYPSINIVGNTLLSDVSVLNSFEGLDSVYVSGNGQLTEISASNLRYLNSLYVEANDSLTHISGFDSVQTISGVSIINNPSLATLDGFDALESARGLFIRNDALQTLSGFGALESLIVLELVSQSLTTVATDVLGSLSQCREITVEAMGDSTAMPSFAQLADAGDIFISTTAAPLPSFSALSTLGPGEETLATGELYLSTSQSPATAVSMCPKLKQAANIRVFLSENTTTFSGFALLNTAESVYVAGDGLVSASGFDQLAVCEGSIVFDGNNLKTISGLGALQRAGSILAQRNTVPLLETFPDLPNLTSLGTLLVNGDHLQQFPAIPGISKLPIIDVRGEGITSLSGLSSITHVLELYIANTQLSSLEDLAGLQAVGDLDGDTGNGISGITRNLTLKNNVNLHTMDGMSGLQSVQNNFEVNGEMMTSLSGLSSLSSVGGDISVVIPPEYYCDAEEWATGVSVGGEIYLGIPPTEGCTQN